MPNQIVEQCSCSTQSTFDDCDLVTGTNAVWRGILMKPCSVNKL
jgi:hypothetical protein